MATIADTSMTLAEHAKRLGPDGKVDAIVELLSRTNEVLQDMRWVEGNLETGHLTTIRTGLPTVTWRKLNRGVQPSKSKVRQVTDTVGICEGYAEVDKRIADLNGNTEAFRLSEDRAFIESFNQEMAGKTFYSDTDTDPETFLGLSPRYPFADSPNVIDAGGTGNFCTSVWVTVWSDQTAFGIFGKGQKAGLRHEDKGQVTLEDEEGKKFEGYRSWWKWEMGLVVRDWRYVVRVANLDTRSLPTTIPNYLIKALNKVPSLRMGAPAIYCNQDIKDQLDILAMNKANAWITQSEDPWGYPITKFRGVPVRRVDQILSTETALAATPS